MSTFWSKLFGGGGRGDTDSGQDDECNSRWGSRVSSSTAAASGNNKKQLSARSSSCGFCPRSHKNDRAVTTPCCKDDEKIEAKHKELNAICEHLNIEKEEIRHHRDVMNPTLVVRNDGYSVPFFSSFFASCERAAPSDCKPRCEPSWQPEPLFCEKSHRPKAEPSFPEPEIEVFGAPPAASMPEDPCGNYCSQFSKDEDSLYEPAPLHFDACPPEDYYYQQYCEDEPTFDNCNTVEELPSQKAPAEDCQQQAEPEVIILKDEVEQILLEDATGLEDVAADDCCLGPTEAEEAAATQVDCSCAQPACKLEPTEPVSPQEECAPQQPPPPKAESSCVDLSSCLDLSLPKLEDICRERKVPASSSCDWKPKVEATPPPAPVCTPEPEPKPQPPTCDCSCAPPPSPVACCPAIPEHPIPPVDVKEIAAKAMQVAAPLMQCASEAAACQQCPRLVICYICDFGDTATPPQDPCTPKPVECAEVPKPADECEEVPPVNVDDCYGCYTPPSPPVFEECVEELPVVDECFEEPPVVEEEPYPCPPIEVCDCSCGEQAVPKEPPEEPLCEPEPEPEVCPPPPEETLPCPVEPEPAPCRWPWSEPEPIPVAVEDDCKEDDEDPNEPPPPPPPLVCVEERLAELREHNSRFMNEFCGCRKCIESGGCCQESDPGPYKCTCPDCGDVRGDNPECSMCNFAVCMDKYSKRCAEEDDTQCDCPDYVRDRCNSTRLNRFDLNPDGTPKCEGAMCLQRAQTYLWESIEPKEPTSYGTLAFKGQEFNDFSDCIPNCCTCECTCGECECGGSSQSSQDRCRGVDRKYHGAMTLDQVQKWFWCHDHR